jgi:hypothetical protein
MISAIGLSVYRDALSSGFVVNPDTLINLINLPPR